MAINNESIGISAEVAIAKSFDLEINPNYVARSEKEIVDLLLAKTQLALDAKNISLEISLDAKKFLLTKGTDLKFGARPLRRSIQRYVEDEISDMILKSEVIAGQSIFVECKNEKLEFKIK